MSSDKSVMVSFRTSQNTKRLLEKVAEEFGSQSAALEFCLHQYAKRQKIRVPSGASVTGETAGAYSVSTPTEGDKR